MQTADKIFGFPLKRAIASKFKGMPQRHMCFLHKQVAHTLWLLPRDFCRWIDYHSAAPLIIK
ncbi:MAG: hypothetical protein KDE46_21235 [Caldilineaceae bacterium]|nr:hypothetical protein [Caldilineaceae bacterium]